MYFAVNIPRHIATPIGVILLTDYCMMVHILKCTGSPPLPPDVLARPSNP